MSLTNLRDSQQEWQWIAWHPQLLNCTGQGGCPTQTHYNFIFLKNSVHIPLYPPLTRLEGCELIDNLITRAKKYHYCRSKISFDNISIDVDFDEDVKLKKGQKAKIKLKGLLSGNSSHNGRGWRNKTIHRSYVPNYWSPRGLTWEGEEIGTGKELHKS